MPFPFLAMSKGFPERDNALGDCRASHRIQCNDHRLSKHWQVCNTGFNSNWHPTKERCSRKTSSSLSLFLQRGDSDRRIGIISHRGKECGKVRSLAKGMPQGIAKRVGLVLIQLRKLLIGIHSQPRPLMPHPLLHIP